MTGAAWICAWPLLVGMWLTVGGCRPTMRPLSQPVPIDLYQEPIQQKFHGNQSYILTTGFGEFALRPRAAYRISAQVISVRRYRSGWEAALSPIDLALVWGEMARGDVVGSMRFFHEHRGYRYELGRVVGFDTAYAESHISNIHIIPASTSTRRGLKTIRPMDRVRLEGLLVDIHGQSPIREYVWKTSLDLSARGAGACQLLFLQKMQVNALVFE